MEGAAPKIPSFWTGQALHFACLCGLVFALHTVWAGLGRPFPTAFWLAAAVPVVHQIWVWVAWRLELQNAAISKTIGFNGYLLIFFLLFAGRFLTLLCLAVWDRGSLGLSPVLQILATGLLLIPALYAMYSVHRYFGMARAAGGDHFEQRFRDMPLEKRGIFRFTDNGMYVFAFLLFWALAVGFNSLAAISVAAFSHAYIWVHFFATEKPDMNYLYGPRN